MTMKRLFPLILCLCLILGLTPRTVLAASPWPSNVSIEADGGILMDADTGTILYGKNENQAYYPASITKILTALIVLEKCDLDEMVTFSHDDVYNVEAGSSTAGIDEGDVLTVRDCLYALLLASANESANALACHVSGSREAFAELMNEKAASLGCTGSHFANPSGLNDENHYTTAHDMALIAQAAIKNPTFVEISGTRSYQLAPTKKNPEGGYVANHHNMIKKNTAVTYPGAFAGKTGYTSLAGNTLVTCAKRDGITLIAVVLNGHQTHYRDTKAMLDFGFSNFQSLKAADHETAYPSLKNDMTIAGMTAKDSISLSLDPNSRVILPKDAVFSDLTPMSWIRTRRKMPSPVSPILMMAMRSEKCICVQQSPQPQTDRRDPPPKTKAELLQKTARITQRPRTATQQTALKVLTPQAAGIPAARTSQTVFPTVFSDCPCGWECVWQAEPS